MYCAIRPLNKGKSALIFKRNSKMSLKMRCQDYTYITHLSYLSLFVLGFKFERFNGILPKVFVCIITVYPLLAIKKVQNETSVPSHFCK